MERLRKERDCAVESRKAFMSRGALILREN